MSEFAHCTDIFDFTYGAVKDLLEPIFDFYPPDPTAGSPYGTGAETFGLTQTYKRLSSFVGDILFQAPRRHFLRETPKDFGEDSWNYVYVEPREGAEPRLGGACSPPPAETRRKGADEVAREQCNMVPTCPLGSGTRTPRTSR